MSASTAARERKVGGTEFVSLVPLVGLELRRALTHPAFLVSWGTVAAAWILTWIVDRSVVQVLVVNVEASTAQLWLLLPVVGAFLAATLIGLADYRFGAEEMLSVTPVSLRTRIVAQMAAALGPACAVLLLLSMRLLMVSSAPGAAGAPPLVGDVLSPVALTLFAAALGTGCAHVLRSLAVSGGVLAVVAVLSAVGAFAAYGTRVQGLVPIMLMNPIAEPPVPTSLLTRPAGLHAAWLVALAVLVLTVSVLRHHGGRTWLVGSVIAAVSTAAIGVAQVRSYQPAAAPTTEWEEQYLAPRATQVCRTPGRDAYCAFPSFASRIPYWQEVVDAQRERLPAAAATTPVFVRQRLSPPMAAASSIPPPLPWDAWRRDDAADGAPQVIPVSTRWARPGTDDFAQTEVLGFAMLSAASLVGWTMPEQTPRNGEVCGAQGVIVAWLATQSSPAVTSAHRAVQANRGGPRVLLYSILGAADSIVVGERETTVAAALADVPEEQLVAALADHWEELSAPHTDVGRAAMLLGVTADLPQPITSVCAEGAE